MTMNLYGNTQKPISDTLMDIEDWAFDTKPTKQSAEEKIFAANRMQQLMELLCMNSPVRPAWFWRMREGCCDV